MLIMGMSIGTSAQKAYRFESIPSFVDNFSRFDSTVWDRWTGYTGNELETYTKSERNSYIKNGRLVIRALEENVNGKNVLLQEFVA